MSHSPFLLTVAGLAGLITFVVTRQVCRDHVNLGPPGLVAAAVSGLAVVGLLATPTGWGEAMLLPYAALGLTLLLLCLLAAFGLLLGLPRWRNSDRETPQRHTEQPSSESARKRRERPRHH